MTNTFLEDLKELGYDQTEALTALRSIKEKGLEPSDPPPPPPPPEEVEEEEIGTPEFQIQSLSEDNIKAILGELKIEKTIKKEVQKQLKVIRGSPPQGTEEDTASNRPIIHKNEFERMV